MKAINFKGTNGFFTDQNGNNTPAHRSTDKKGIVVARFKFSFWERIYVLFFGKIWFSQATYNANIKPFIITIHKGAVLARQTPHFKSDEERHPEEIIKDIIKPLRKI